MKKLLFIFNPRSGKGQIREHLPEILDTMQKAGFDVTTHVTQCRGDAIDVTRERAGEFDRVVCSGGDGTLDEVVTGMMQRPEAERVPIGYIPAGSTNDFGNSLGITKDMPKAAEIAANGTPFSCDIGGFNNTSFVYVAAFGIFTEVSYATPQDLKNNLGHVAYLLEATKQIADIKYSRMQVEYDGNVLYDEFIFGMITNSKSVGGMTGIIPAPYIDLTDGLFEVTLVRHPRTPLELNEIVQYMLGHIPDSTMVYAFQTSQVKFTSAAPVSWTLDGEFGGEQDVSIAKNCHNAIQIIVEQPDNI